MRGDLADKAVINERIRGRGAKEKRRIENRGINGEDNMTTVLELESLATGIGGFGKDNKQKGRGHRWWAGYN